MTLFSRLIPRRHTSPAWSRRGRDNGKIKPRSRPCRTRLPLPFCTAWISLCLLLSFAYWMSVPILPPSSRFIGFQAFEKIIEANPAKGTATKIPQDASRPVGNTSIADAEVNAATGYGPAYPLDVYSPLVHNPVPLTEITVQACFPSWLQKCKPLTTPEKDAKLGPWVLVERPLNSGTAESKSKSIEPGWAASTHDLFGILSGAFETNYIFYRRSRRTDVPRIVDLKILDTGKDGLPVNGEDMTGWHRCDQDMRAIELNFHSSATPRHLYYRTIGGANNDQESLQRPSSDASKNAQKNLKDGDPITEIDVIYGPGPMWPGFERIGEVEPGDESLHRAAVSLSARRRPQALPELPIEPSFKTDGSFTIMQLADLHFSVEHGECRDVSWASNESPCVGDNDTIKMLSRWLDEEKPDLVVLSGDQLNGQMTSWDERSVIPKWVQPLIDRKIPWASIQGNHDSQSGVVTRREQQSMLASLPYSYTRAGPASLHEGTGAGNFYLKLKSPTPDSMHLFTLYFLDSGAYAPKDLWHPFKFAGYDYIRDDQRDWFKKVSSKIHPITRPYIPDGAKDLGKLWDRSERRRRGASVRGASKVPRTAAAVSDAWSTGDQSHLAKPKALLFTHIPVPEMADAADVDEHGNVMQFGERQETASLEGAQKKPGIFMDLVRAAEQPDANGQLEVVALLHGHMHNNLDCQRTRGIWICFNGGSSFAGYGKRGLERRTRILRIARWGEQVDTWSRLEKTPGRVEQHVLYSEGSS